MGLEHVERDYFWDSLNNNIFDSIYVIVALVDKDSFVYISAVNTGAHIYFFWSIRIAGNVVQSSRALVIRSEGPMSVWVRTHVVCAMYSIILHIQH